MFVASDGAERVNPFSVDENADIAADLADRRLADRTARTRVLRELDGRERHVVPSLVRSERTLRGEPATCDHFHSLVLLSLTSSSYSTPVLESRTNRGGRNHVQLGVLRRSREMSDSGRRPGSSLPRIGGVAGDSTRSSFSTRQGVASPPSSFPSRRRLSRARRRPSW